MQLLLLPLLAIMSSSQAQADTIVRMSHGPQAPRWAEVEETLSVGLVDEDPDYNFFGVTGLAIGKDGSMVVLEASLMEPRPQLRMYDAEGRFVRRMGRAGQGPGEFVRPTTVASMPDGRFLLAELLQRRMTVYSAQGEFEETWRVPHHGISPLGMWVSPSGIVAMPVLSSERVGPVRDPSIVRIAPGGSVIDTLSGPELPELSTPLVMSRSRTRSIMRTPYASGTRWAWHPHGFFVTVRTDRYAIDLRRPRSRPEESRPSLWREGDPVVSIRADVEPVPVHPEERRDRQRYLDEMIRRPGWTVTGSLDPVPPVKPIISAVHAADDGRIWVQLHAESERIVPETSTSPSGEPRVAPVSWRSTFVWDVFDLDGTYKGRVRLPTLTRIQFRGDHVWGFIYEEEFRVPILKRYRIRWPPSG